MKTRATRKVLRAIVRRDYAGSQADFSKRCGLDTADTSRVIAGIRPATIGFVARVTSVLASDSAARLLAAFLSDVASEVSDAFSATIAVQAKPPAAPLDAADRRPCESPGRPRA